MATKKTASPSATLEKLFDTKVPARVAMFLDGPELAKFDGARAWGLEGFDASDQPKVTFASKKLKVFHEYAEDMESQPYLPIAAVGSETYMFAVDPTKTELPVFFFDYETGYKPFADDFDAFLGKLLKKGEKSPIQKLESAHKKASGLHGKKKYKEALAELEPVLLTFPKTMRRSFDGPSETLGAAYNIAGICHEKLGDIDRAIEAYTLGYQLGASSAALNVCDLYLNHFKDPKKLVEYAESIKGEIFGFADAYGWFHVRNYIGIGALMLGQTDKAIRAYHQIKNKFETSDREKIAEAVKDLRELKKPEADTIAAWLDAPPPALSPERAKELDRWWSTLTEPVKEGVREAAGFKKDPGEAELARISILDEIEVDKAKLDSLEWVTPLTLLEDVDVEENEIEDLSPLAKLRRLRSVRLGKNKVKDLSPLAGLRRLERLGAGENAIVSLEPLSSLHRLDYLHLPKNEIKSVEPLRGLPELKDVTIYENEISDISPMVECPRLEKLSFFSNPAKESVLSLAKATRLSSVDLPHDTSDEDQTTLKNALPGVYMSGADDPPAKEWLDEARAWWKGLQPAWRKRLQGKMDKDDRQKPEPSDEAFIELLREDHLSFEDQELGTLEPLGRFEYVDFLNIEGTGTSDLSPLASCSRLRDVIMRRNPITTFATAKNLASVEEIYADDCKLVSLEGLEGCKALRELHGDDNAIASLAPLAGLAELRELILDGNAIESVEPLRGKKRLRKLCIAANRVKDLSPLADCDDLEVIECYSNAGLSGASKLADIEGLMRITSHGSLPASEIAELRRRRPDVAVD